MDASNRKDIRAAEKAAALFEKQRGEVVAQLMSYTAGRAWVLNQLTRAHIFDTSFTGEALSSAFAEGQRNIGLQLLNDIMAFAPDQYIIMMRENNERSAAAAAAERARSENANGGVEGSVADDAAFTDADRYETDGPTVPN